jgi:hypothetical protein
MQDVRVLVELNKWAIKDGGGPEFQIWFQRFIYYF